MKPSRVGFVIVVLLSFVQLVGAEEPTVRMQDIERVIRESEYHVTWQDQTVLPDLETAWQAPNRAQNLRFYFTDDGLRVVDRTADGSPELLRLRVVGMPPIDGAPATFEPVESGLVIHRGTLSEEFTNRANGLQHVLIINEPQPGDGPLEIELEWSAAGMRVTQHSVEFQTISGRRLIYSIGETSDAAGSSVDVVLSVRDRRLVLALSDSDTVCPVTVKNLLSGIADTVLESNLTGLDLGLSVTTGDLNGDGFSDVAATAPRWDGGQVAEGAVLVFHGRPGGITSNGGSTALAPNAVIESQVTGYFWPHHVAIVGDVNGDGYQDLAAGHPIWDPSFPVMTRAYGAVWVFQGSPSGISATSAADYDGFIASDLAGSRFGDAIQPGGDINGDGYSDLIVGSPFWTDGSPGQTYEGGAFVFHGSSMGITAASLDVADSVIEGNDPLIYAGFNVAGLGDVNGDGFDDVAVAVAGLTDPETNEGGIAILHGGSAGIASNPNAPLTTAASSLIEGNQANLNLNAVAGAGDVNGDGYDDVIIGSDVWGDSASHANEGLVVICHGGPLGIGSNQTTPLEVFADTVIEGNPMPHTSLFLGAAIASAGDCNGDGFGDVTAGAPGFENGEPGEGAFFVFFGGSDGVPSSGGVSVQEAADIVVESNMTSMALGETSTASASDINGDGYSDLVIPVPYYTNPEAEEGAVFIYHGGAEMLAEEPDGQIHGVSSDFYLGRSVASAGDVNGDGFADLAVGAPSSVGIGSNPEGTIFVFHGSRNPDLSAPDWSVEGDNVEEGYGRVVNSAGDVNGDGFGDVVVGAPRFTNGEIEEGRAEVFLGSASGLAIEPDWSFESNVAGALFGYDAAPAGDVNGDGYGDLIVGAPNYGLGQTDEGRAYLFFGSRNGLGSNPGWVYESDLTAAWLGAGVSGAGDVNGDGFADVVVGAPYYESGEADEGAAYGFWGSSNGLSDVPNWFIETNRAGAHYGIGIAGAGDVNADGFSDVIVGATWDSNPEHHEGRAYLYHGSIGGLSTSADVVLETNRADGGFGLSVEAAGDVNADGFSDVIVGANTDSGALGSEGRAYVFLGSSLGVANQPAWFVQGDYLGDELGSSVAGIGDHDGDGFSDVVVGVPYSDVGAVLGGSVELYLGNGGAGRPVLARQMRGGDDPTPVQPWGLTHSGDAFNVAMTATSPRGRELVKLHVEACPPGEPFGDVACRHAVSADWTAIPLGENGVVLTEAISGLTEGELYRWRAHVLYVPLHADEPGITTPPVPRHGPWRTLFAQRPAADIRVGAPQQITIEFVSPSSSVPEGAPQAEVDIVMTTSDGEPTEVDSSVDFDIFNGSAFAGEDYVHTSFNRFFPGGTTSGAAQIIPVDLISDALDESDEDFIVELYNPMGAIVGPQNTHTVTILDDDPPPELSAVDIGVDEGAGLAVVQLELSAPTAFEVTVAYGTVDGTAAAPFDFIHVGGTALIPPMDTIFNVEIPIENDWLEEGEESFILDLWSPSNAALVTSEVTVTIFDNDAGILFADGFEIGNTSAWSWTVP